MYYCLGYSHVQLLISLLQWTKIGKQCSWSLCHVFFKHFWCTNQHLIHLVHFSLTMHIHVLPLMKIKSKDWYLLDCVILWPSGYGNGLMILVTTLMGLNPVAAQRQIHTYIYICYLLDEVGIVSCAIRCIMQIKSL